VTTPRAARSPDPFQILGLDHRPELSDDDVRAAWRRVAAATHPDRGDGGDPEAFAVAAAAYTVLRTRSGRSEALADLQRAAGGKAPGYPVPVRKAHLARLAISLPWRARCGRPGRLAVRLLTAAAVGVLAIAAIGWQPASYALITGALTWLVVSGRPDLAPQAGADRLGRPAVRTRRTAACRASRSQRRPTH
jgi:curved DNA-binding protein CbpA